MRLETRQCLADARAAGSEAIALAITRWADDRTRALAIERLLMIVGEALVRIRTLEPDVLDGLADAHRFIGMRNVLVHGYDDLDPQRIEEALRSNLPALTRGISNILGDQTL